MATSSASASGESKIELLAMTQPSPLLLPQLEGGYLVHEFQGMAPERFAQVAPRIRGVFGGGESVLPGDLIARLPALEVVTIMGVGYDGVDVAAAKARGVPVTHTPDVLNDDVADLALALMLGISRQLVQADCHVRSGAWSREPLALGRKMSGARLGIVGIGRIGRGIARRAAAFDMKIAYTARNARAELPFTYFPNAVELAAASDYLVVITPGGAATRKLIGADVLRALGPDGILVNVARGSVVDEAALIEALRSKTIAGAALDVFENEPNIDERLRELPNVLLTPHIGSATFGTRQAMADLVVANLRAHFAGQPLVTPVPECRG
ncbi:MAG TPA: 2-hydroxyacid dehydrogenase [Ramlibacter sp.]|uniref:2-hydroxyacid dehydrogenase n=1 Tax=Ramlibacter sp. TaxID=1917967 RepID=UPI002C70290C|nr:2-hydroxyacid dehydrogenase [Ramlibacter sp.]HVZ44904.1 2-hydroxyacid dehydrogenase [Ramlibacter sp.]